MKIDKDTVDKIAELAKLEFDDQSKQEIISDLNRIIGFIEKLNELDTRDTEPLLFMNDEKNVLREDQPGTMLSHEEALKNATQKDSDYFRVPKVLNK